jgi:16S rRNA (uracil1498-N3)-methyltransferase
MTRLVLERELAVGETVTVTGDEAHYLIRVRRHRKADRVELRTPAGRRFTAVVEQLDRSAATLLIEDELASAPDPSPVRLIVAIPKRQLLDEVIRRISEVGAGRLSPVTCERSVVDPGPARVERWRRIASESMRQCGRATPLVIDPVRPLGEALADAAETELRVALHPDDDGAPPLLELLGERPPSIALAVGPEGGFSEAELALAAEHGYRPARLGPLIMRIETAAVIAAGLSIAFVGGFD